MTMITELSGNEIYCLAQKEYNPGKYVCGNSVTTLGLAKIIESHSKGIVGKEIQSLSKMLNNGRNNAYQRMLDDTTTTQANGIVGISSKLIFHSNHLEFLTTGNAISNKNHAPFFSSSSDGRQIYALLDSHYIPLSFVFSNVAYSTAMTGGMIGKLKAFQQGEVRHLSDTFNQTRGVVLNRLVQKAKENNANAVIDVKITTMQFSGVNEMLMAGTAVQHPVLAGNDIKTSSLSNDELWSLAKMGYAPKQIVFGSVVFSIGFVSRITSVIKSIYLNETPELTRLFNHARNKALAIMDQSAKKISADEIIGLQVKIYNLGNGLIECFAYGTAVEKLSGINTYSDQLPVQVFLK